MTTDSTPRVPLQSGTRDRNPIVQAASGTPAPDATTSIASSSANAPSIDGDAAANLLAQLRQDREASAERIMAPNWYYTFSCLLGIVTCLLLADFFSRVGYQMNADWWRAHTVLSVSGITEFIAILMATHVSLQINAWRKQQIGGDFDTFGGLIAPRNAVMWTMAIVFYALTALGVAYIILGPLGLPWLPYDSEVAPSIIALAMGAVGGLGEYAYDRYCVRLMKRDGYDA
ncbi:hypothetical protein [Bifidobacterium aesculapii]|uniref:hypothetical protein n=1 Tax=Bifidobacterium aesculapii TaxID=1329411 RepID=UPI0006E1D6DB|nr:hypothetical protein [Bifidobacterium aesculapii]